MWTLIFIFIYFCIGLLGLIILLAWWNYLVGKQMLSKFGHVSYFKDAGLVGSWRVFGSTWSGIPAGIVFNPTSDCGFLVWQAETVSQFRKIFLYKNYSHNNNALVSGFMFKLEHLSRSGRVITRLNFNQARNPWLVRLFRANLLRSEDKQIVISFIVEVGLGLRIRWASAYLQPSNTW